MTERILLREWCETSPEMSGKILGENVRTKDGIYIAGVIQMAETKNNNGRIYPRKVLEREMTIYNKLIRENRAIGELDHPESEIPHLVNASHIIEETWWEGNAVMGRIRVLRHTPSGKILEGLLEDGVRVGVSSRSIGSLHESSNGLIVGDDLMLICFDIVANPSTMNAFPIRESVEYRKFLPEKREDRINRVLNEILYKKSR